MSGSPDVWLPEGTCALGLYVQLWRKWEEQDIVNQGGRSLHV